jgi:serine/threonine-protein kinase
VGQSVKPADGVAVGQVFQGKYRVDAILGQGGMGVVAECTHLALNERVAIKMLRQDVLLDQDAVSRFIREAQAAVKLKSEYVARVSDVGTFENGVPYMVMEFLDGQDLGDLIKERGVLPVQWAVELMLQTAEALAEAHSLSIVHRDIKPTNLFVTWRPDGTALIKVLDFGISKSPMGTDMQLTQTQSLLGTPAYMSPEQMRSARLVDMRTDIWSLGTVFYEILEGRRPFEAESFSEMCVKVAVDPPAPMVNTPPPLQNIILKCIAKSPEQRYASMAEFARDLVPFANDPHQAQMLVERMTRMLGRGGFNWEGTTTGVNRQSFNAPQSVRDLGSGPLRTPPLQWGAGSDPAARPWHGHTPRGDASQPFARPLPDEAVSQSTVSTKKSKWPLILILLFATLATAGVVGFVVANQASNKPAPKENEAKIELPTTKVEAPPPTPTAPVPTPPPVEVKDETPVETPVVETKATKSTKKTGGTKSTKTKAVKEVEPPPVETKPVETKPCDPFSSMHSCSK